MSTTGLLNIDASDKSSGWSFSSNVKKMVKVSAVVACICATVVICYYDIYQASQINRYIIENISQLNNTCGAASIDEYNTVGTLFVVKSIFDLLFFLFAIVNIIMLFVVFGKCVGSDFSVLCWFFSSIFYVLYNVISYSLIKGINICHYIDTYQKYGLYMSWYHVSFIFSCMYGGVLGVLLVISGCKSNKEYKPLQSKNEI